MCVWGGDVHGRKDKLVILQIHKALLLVRIQKFASTVEMEPLIAPKFVLVEEGRGN